jgi:hypothetical protein
MLLEKVLCFGMVKFSLISEEHGTDKLSAIFITFISICTREIKNSARFEPESFCSEANDTPV